MVDYSEYDSKLYLDHPELENWLGRWANGDGPKSESRVCSIVAAPGLGKTWLMREVERKWKQGNGRDPFAERRLVFWLSVPEMVQVQTDGGALDDVKLKSWLEAQHAQVTDIMIAAGKKADPKRFRKLSSRRALTHVLDAFAEDLCNVAKNWPFPIILVDGYDDVTSELDEQLDNQVLEPLFSAECTRILIGHRPWWSLSNGDLRDAQTQVSLGTRELAKEQFELLIGTHNITPPDYMRSAFNAWQSQLRHYKWNHFLINSFLFARAFERLPDGILECKDLEDCANYIIDRHHGGDATRRPVLTPPSFQLLNQIAVQIEDKWTYEDLLEKLNVLQSAERLQLLFKYGVIISIEDPRSSFKVVDGLREMLRDLSDCQSGINSLATGERPS